MQLEEQRKAYEDMKRKMEILQSAQSEDENRFTTGSSGYAEFSGTNVPQGSGNALASEQQQSQELVASAGAQGGEGEVAQSGLLASSNKMFTELSGEEAIAEAAPYMVSSSSHCI